MQKQILNVSAPKNPKSNFTSSPTFNQIKTKLKKIKEKYQNNLQDTS